MRYLNRLLGSTTANSNPPYQRGNSMTSVYLSVLSATKCMTVWSVGGHAVYIIIYSGMPGWVGNIQELRGMPALLPYCVINDSDCILRLMIMTAY